MFTTLSLRPLMAVLLASTCAISVSAAPQTPLGGDAGVLLGSDETTSVVDTQQGFVWSPDFGFSPIQLPSDAAPDNTDTLVGLAGTEVPGKGFKWHPDFGLVPADIPAGGAPAGAPVPWSPTGNALRTVIWSAEDLQALVAKISPPNGVDVVAVNDVAPNGTVLGSAKVGDTGESGYFLWNAGAPIELLDAGPGVTIVSVSALSDSGHVIGQVRNADGAEMAAVAHPDGSVRILPGPDGSGSVAKGVNSNGAVVGVSANRPETALLWGADGQPVVLADQLSSPLPDGFQLLGASDINNAGQIAATAVSGSGTVHLVTLTPDQGGAGPYTPRVIGEIYASATEAPIGRLSLSEGGAVVGECTFGARDCPTGEFDFSGLDPNITNLLNPNGTGPVGFLPLITGSSFGLPGGAGLGAGAGGGAAGPASFDRSRPDFGTPNFPTLSSGTATDDGPASAAPISAPVPLPAAGLLLLLGVILLRGPAGVANALRRSVARRRTA